MVLEFNIRTFETEEFIEITPYVYRAIQASGVESGMCHVFIPHTTAGVTINENADPDVVDDILGELEMIVPREDNYAHAEGNSAAHIKSSMMGVSLPVIIYEGALLLGRWQGIYLAEFDGPRTRTVFVKIMPDPENVQMLQVDTFDEDLEGQEDSEDA